MSFLALLVSYFLQQKLDLSLSDRFDQASLRLLRPKQFSLLVNSQWGGAVLVLLIVAAYFSVTYAYFVYIASWLWGSVALVSEVLLLLLLLGQQGFKACLGEYLEAWCRGDFEAAGFKQQTLSGINAYRIENPVMMHNEVCTALLYHNFNRFFVIIFWFMVVGPAAAVAVRLVDLLARHASLAVRSQATKIKMLVEWFPVRLLAFSFALCGDFIGGARYGVKSITDFTIDASTVLRDAASGALDSLDLNHVVEAAMPRDELIVRGERGIEAIRDLLSRSMALWLGIFAILAILGW